MDAAERTEIERACERLVVQYCHFIDHGEAGRVAELFSEDGVWTSPDVTMEGIEQIRRGFAHRESQIERISRHVCNNTLIEVVDDDHATGCVYLTLYRHDGKADRALAPLEGPFMVGEYRDDFVRTSAGWRIQRREIAVAFARGVKA